MSRIEQTRALEMSVEEDNIDVEELEERLKEGQSAMQRLMLISVPKYLVPSLSPGGHAFPIR